MKIIFLMLPSLHLQASLHPLAVCVFIGATVSLSPPLNWRCLTGSSLSQSRLSVSLCQNCVDVIICEGGPSPMASILVLLVPHHHPQPGDAAPVEAPLAVQDVALVHHLDHNSLVSLPGERSFVLFDDLHRKGDVPLLLRMFGGVMLPHVAGLGPGLVGGEMFPC